MTRGDVLAKTQRRRVFFDRIDGFLDRINRIDRIMLLIFLPQRRKEKTRRAQRRGSVVTSLRPLRNPLRPLRLKNGLTGAAGWCMKEVSRVFKLCAVLFLSPERAKGSSVGQRPTKRASNNISPVRAWAIKAYALTGLEILFGPIRRALPYAIACRAFSPFVRELNDNTNKNTIRELEKEYAFFMNKGVGQND